MCYCRPDLQTTLDYCNSVTSSAHCVPGRRLPLKFFRVTACSVTLRHVVGLVVSCFGVGIEGVNNDISRWGMLTRPLGLEAGLTR